MLSLCRITIIIFIINLVLISYTAYVFYFKFNENNSKVFISKKESKDYLIEEQNEPKIKEIHSKNNYLSNGSDVMSIEIWSKASIGFYLWQHILKAPIDSRLDTNVYQSGSTKVDKIKFKFRSGALLTTDSLEHLSTENLILVLNGRDKQKVRIASDWIKALEETPNIKNVGLVLLGDEKCHNHWINPYLKHNSKSIKFLFVVYDWKHIDNQQIYQWPLGVATYRHFPNPDSSEINLGTTRPYVCNFVATIYPDSSRKELLNLLLKNYEKICIIKTRMEWQPKETTDSLNYYIESLRLSDLTLSPIGMNHECYRIYEAMAFGSVPVVEEDMNHVIKTSCDTTSAYRLLKENNAPFIYVSNWTKQLPDILDNELNLSLEFKIQRRLEVIKFYSKFKTIIKNQFLRVINEKFK